MTMTTDSEIVKYAIAGLEAMLDRLRQAQAGFRDNGSSDQARKPGRQKGRRFSAASKRKMREAQKRRWAAWRAEHAAKVPRGRRKSGKARVDDKEAA